MMVRTTRVERRRAGQQEHSGGGLPRTHLWQSCTVNTPPRPVRNFGKTSGGTMNVTAGEEKMITLQRRLRERGGGVGTRAEEEKLL